MLLCAVYILHGTFLHAATQIGQQKARQTSFKQRKRPNGPTELEVLEVTIQLLFVVCITNHKINPRLAMPVSANHLLPVVSIFWGSVTIIQRGYRYMPIVSSFNLQSQTGSE